MGLDVLAYSGLERINCVFDRDGNPIDVVNFKPIEGMYVALTNPDFPERCELEDGLYRYKSAINVFHGTYGKYSVWREELAILSGWECVEFKHPFFGTVKKSHAASACQSHEGPFWEIIYFSDCQGVLGPAVCRKLAQDFASFDDAAKTHVAQIASRAAEFYPIYQSFRDGVNHAALDGAIRFC